MGVIRAIQAKSTMEQAVSIQNEAIDSFKKVRRRTNTLLGKIGRKELDILSSFEKFSDIIEKIQGRPEFKGFERNGVKLPKIKFEEIKQAGTGAGVLLSGLGGAAIGSFAGYSAVGAATTAIVVFGTTASGTAISTLSGAALTNAVLATAGGGALAVGGGGVALGSAMVGGPVLAILAAMAAVELTSRKLSKQADEALEQARRTEAEVNEILKYLQRLEVASKSFMEALDLVDDIYRTHLISLDIIVNSFQKTDWEQFTESERDVTQNTILLVGLLYKMCQVQLVKKFDDKKENKKDIDTVNSKVIDSSVKDAGKIVSSVPVINEEVVEAYKPKRGRKKKLIDDSELDFYLKDDKGKNVTVKRQVSSGAVDIPKDACDKDVSRAVAIMTGLSERQADDVLEAMKSIITKEIKKGNEVKITNFGTFCLSKREAREGRNPMTGQVVKIKASKAPKFKPAKALEEKVKSIIVFKFENVKNFV